MTPRRVRKAINAKQAKGAKSAKGRTWSIHSVDCLSWRAWPTWRSWRFNRALNDVVLSDRAGILGLVSDRRRFMALAYASGADTTDDNQNRLAPPLPTPLSQLLPPNSQLLITPLTLQLEHRVQTRAQPTERTLQVAAMFGLSLDATHEHTILPPIELTLGPGQVVFVTGVSGGGKSTLLRRVKAQLTDQHAAHPADEHAPANKPTLVCCDDLPPLADRALVDALAHPEGAAGEGVASADIDTVCRWLSRAGLNDAAVMLRTPSQLSVGQRHRLRLAQAIAVAERSGAAWSVLLADEFASSLDRTTAHALARSTRRWVARSNLCLIAATAHDDLLEPLAPDVLVEVGPGGSCEVHTRHA